MSFSIIVAIDENSAIGRCGDQLAYISDDLKRFKQLTTGHTIVMGRKTFMALPKGALPNRRNIVMSHISGLTLPGCEVAASVDDVITMCTDNSDVFIIGGGEIYKLFFQIADSIYLTQIHHVFDDCDTFFPKIDEDKWVTEINEGPFNDHKNGFNYSYKLLKRR